MRNRTPEDLVAKRLYWNYQYRLGRDYIVPLLNDWGVPVSGKRVVDLGCAEAGVLVAFAEAGATPSGLEIRPARLRLAERFARERGIEMELIEGDILCEEDISRLGSTNDLVVMRDVLEHLPAKAKALKHVRKVIAEGNPGVALITFPPYWSPFAGHQQMLSSFFRRVPCFHWLPSPLFAALAAIIRKIDRHPHILDEMSLFRREKLSLRRFEDLAASAGLRVAQSRFYIIRPSHRLRYGWPALSAGALGRVPVLREFVVSGAFYLVAPTTSAFGAGGGARRCET